MEKFPGGGTKVVERGRFEFGLLHHTPKRKVIGRRKKRKKWCLCRVNIGSGSFPKQEERKVPVEEKEESKRKDFFLGLFAKSNCAP